MQYKGTIYETDRLAHLELMASTNWSAQSIAEFLIPDTRENPIDNWRDCAQQFVRTIIVKLKEQNSLTLERFKHYTLTAQQSAVVDLLAKTDILEKLESESIFDQIRVIVADCLVTKNHWPQDAFLPGGPLDLSREARAKRIADLNGEVPGWARDNSRLNPTMLRKTQSQIELANAFLKNKQYFSVATHPVTQSHKMVLPGVMFERGGEVFPEGTDTSIYNPGLNFCYPIALELAEKVSKFLSFNEYPQNQDAVYAWVHRLNGVAYVSAHWYALHPVQGTPRQCCIHFSPGLVSDFSALEAILGDPLLSDFECTVRTIDHLDAFEFVRLVERERNICESAVTNSLAVF